MKPRTLMAMLDEYKKSELEKIKLLAIFINNPKAMLDYEEEKDAQVPGIDIPAGDTGWMSGNNSMEIRR